MTVDLRHYVEVLKKHEETRASTDERNAYWKLYKLTKQEPTPVPKSLSRFEHG